MSTVKRKKICILVESYSPMMGGIATFTKTLAEGLSGRNYDVKVLLTGKTNKVLKCANTTIPNLIVRSSGSALRMFKSLIQSDLIVFSNFSLKSFPLVWVSRKKFLIIHHISPFCHSRELNWREWIKQRIFTRTNNVFVSENLKLLSGLNGLVVCNGTSFPIDSAKNVNNRIGDFLYVGRLIPEKGVQTAILAFSVIVPLHDDLEFNIVGDGQSRLELEQVVMQLKIEKNVKFLGSIDEFGIRALLKTHKFLVFPSEWQEPFVLVAIEALTQGCIPIVADVGGILEACKNRAVAFESRNISQLAETLESSLINYSAVYKSIFDGIDFEDFSSQTMLSKYELVIEDLLNSKYARPQNF